MSNSDDFVFEKGIFNNIFEKDIRRVFIYKKAEQLAESDLSNHASILRINVFKKYELTRLLSI